mgnify:FL=1
MPILNSEQVQETIAILERIAVMLDGVNELLGAERLHEASLLVRQIEGDLAGAWARKALEEMKAQGTNVLIQRGTQVGKD